MALELVFPFHRGLNIQFISNSQNSQGLGLEMGEDLEKMSLLLT